MRTVKYLAGNSRNCKHGVAITSLCAMALSLAPLLTAQTGLMPLGEVKKGMRGTGRTVFSGNEVQNFDVEVLGILENLGPRQSLILARLAGGPLASTGVLQGMSGSPVYIGGRLIGAVAMAFPFAKEPIAGIRPIEEMLRVEAPSRRAMAATAAASFGDSKMSEIATPVSFNGFTRETLDHFSPQLRALGLEPRQGVSGGSQPNSAPNGQKLEPGSMISVQLVSGDLNVGADGTVTHIDGNRIYAFGHRFLAMGETEMPFARAEVLTLLPNLNSSFKISSSYELLGSITQDRNTAVAGELGRKAVMAPVSITVSGPRRTSYKMEMVNDRFLSPFLLQMALYSAIDSTERMLGLSSLRLRGEIEFASGAPPLRIDNIFAGDFGAPVAASLAAATPLSFAMQSGPAFERLRSIDLRVESSQNKIQWQVERLHPVRATVRPGETAEMLVAFAGDGGGEQIRRVQYPVPTGMAYGPLYFSVSDGPSTNASEFKLWQSANGRTPSQVVAFLNGMRGNSSAYVRVWRADPGYQTQGEDLPAPPASMALIFARTPGALGGPVMARTTKLAEIEIPLGEAIVTGSRTAQVEIKE